MRNRQKNNPIGWVAVLKDGTTLSESAGTPWSSVQDRIVSLSLSAGGTTISLPPNRVSYVQGKTASCPVSGGNAKIESRWIGFKSSSGDCTIVRVSEDTGKISVEVL